MKRAAADERAAGWSLDFRSLVRTFRADSSTDVAAIADFSLHIDAGELVVVVGPSGCGKSTLLRLAAGLDVPDAGRVCVGDVDAAVRLRRVAAADAGSAAELACVFQDAHLLPWRSVLDNVALPLELVGRAKDRARAVARDAVEQVGLADSARLYPAQLSGGMRMRVSLARALVTRPRVLLLDEPFGALDEITRHALQEQLRALWQSSSMTVMFVTHSIAEATFLAERVIVLTPRPARIVLDHRVELPRERTAPLRTDAGFAAEMRLLQDALRSSGVQA